MRLHERVEFIVIREWCAIIVQLQWRTCRVAELPSQIYAKLQEDALQIGPLALNMMCMSILYCYKMRVVYFPKIERVKRKYYRLY